MDYTPQGFGPSSISGPVLSYLRGTGPFSPAPSKNVPYWREWAGHLTGSVFVLHFLAKCLRSTCLIVVVNESGVLCL